MHLGSSIQTEETTHETDIQFMTFVYSDDFLFKKELLCRQNQNIKNSIVLGAPESRNDLMSDCNFENSLIPSILNGENSFFTEPGFLMIQ